MQRQAVWSVGKGGCGVVMDLHENPIESTCGPGPRHIFNKIGIPSAACAQASRPLEAVSNVVNKRISESPHYRKPAKVDHQIVIAEARAALGHYNPRVALGRCLINDVLHVLRR